MMNQKKGEHIKMNAQKKLGKNTELDKTITNKIHNTNYGVSSHVIQRKSDETIRNQSSGRIYQNFDF